MKWLIMGCVLIVSGCQSTTVQPFPEPPQALLVAPLPLQRINAKAPVRASEVLRIVTVNNAQYLNETNKLKHLQQWVIKQGKASE